PISTLFPYTTLFRSEYSRRSRFHQLPVKQRCAGTDAHSEISSGRTCFGYHCNGNIGELGPIRQRFPDSVKQGSLVMNRGKQFSLSLLIALLFMARCEAQVSTGTPALGTFGGGP